MKEYVVIYHSEDGNFSIESLGKEELEEKLNENYWGPNKLLNELISWGSYGQPGLLILKAQLVVPKPVKVVEKYSL